jgi:hypothetical protein
MWRGRWLRGDFVLDVLYPDESLGIGFLGLLDFAAETPPLELE